MRIPGLEEAVLNIPTLYLHIPEKKEEETRDRREVSKLNPAALNQKNVFLLIINNLTARINWYV